MARSSFLLTNEQMARLEPYLPVVRGRPRTEDRLVISGMIFVIVAGIPWNAAPNVYGPHQTLYDRFVRWSRTGVMNHIFRVLALDYGDGLRLVVDAKHIAQNKPGASFLKRGFFPTITEEPPLKTREGQLPNSQPVAVKSEVSGVVKFRFTKPWLIS